MPLCGARAKSLNSYLKSLRNKRNTERAALRGQERKVGVEKSEYLALDWGRETSLKIKSLRESPRSDQKRKKERGGGAGRCMYMCVCVRVCVCMNT